MIEKIEIFSESRNRGIEGSTFVLNYTIGAQPLSEQSEDEDSFDDSAKVDESMRVKIIRTPNTEKDVVSSSFVGWRGERWIVKSRIETKYRTHYELTLERTVE